MPVDRGTGSRPPAPPTPRLVVGENAHDKARAGLDARQFVLRRQRRLRAAGFTNVTLDGIWGPVSQRAWTDFVRARKARIAGRVNAPLAIIRGEDTASKATAGRARAAKLPGPKPAAAARASAQGAIEASRRAMLQMKLAQVDHIQQSGTIRNPSLPADPQTRTLPAGTRGPLRAGGADVISRGERNAMYRVQVERERQEGLRAVVEMQKKAKLFADRARTKTPEAMTLKELVATTVDPTTGSFDPQNPQDVQRVQRWLRAHGKPEVALDGEWGVKTYNALQQSIHAAQVKEHDQAIGQLTKSFYDTGVISKANPLPLVGGVPTPEELFKLLNRNGGGGFTAAVILRELVKRGQSRGPFFAEPGFAEWRTRFLNQQAHALYGPFFHDFLGGSEAYINSILPANVTITLQSRTFDEMLKKAWSRERAEAQRRSLEIAKQQAGHERGFWGHVIHGTWDHTAAPTLDFLDFAGKQFRHGLATGGVLIGDIGATALYGGDNLSLMQASERADLLLEDFKRDHPYWNLTAEIVVDPFNLVPGRAIGAALAAPYRILRRGAEGLETVGIGTTRMDSFGRVVTTSPANAIRSLEWGVDVAARASKSEWEKALLSPTPLGKAYDVFKKATALKPAVVAAAKRRAKGRLAHGMRGMNAKLPADLVKLGEQSEYEVLKQLDKPIGRFIDAAVNHGASLYIDEKKTWGLSSVGYRLVARLNTEIVQLHVDRFAHLEANQAFRDVVARGGDEDKAAEAWARVYEDINRRGVGFAVGPLDPHIEEQIGHLIAYDQEHLELTFLPAVQQQIEKRIAERVVETGREEFGLWDEGGVWAGKAGKVEETMQQVALDAFAPEETVRVRNPLWEENPHTGEWKPRHFSADEARRIIKGELDKYERFLYGYRGVRDAAGTLRRTDDEWILDKVQEKTQKVTAAWKADSAGRYDSREFLDVPPAYLRRWQELVPQGSPQMLPVGAVPKWAAPFAQVALPNTQLASMPVEIELREIAGWLTGISERNVTYPKYLSELERGAEGRVAGDDKALFHSAIKAHQEVTREAYNRLIAAELARQGLVWQAIRHAQGWHFKTLYYAVAAPMAVWRFATLPLRLGWVVRNVIDNTVKLMLEGVRNPAALFAGAERPFDHGLRAMLQAAKFLDGLFGTNAAVGFQRVIDEFYEGVESNVLSRIFGTHGMPVPSSLIDSAKMVRAGADDGERLTLAHLPADVGRAGDIKDWWNSITDGAWELFANRPENFAKRALYRRTYLTAIKDGASEEAAAMKAWKSVEKTLFDYSKVTVIEDNFRVFFPFIQYWRKNTTFWARTAVEKPWFVRDLVTYKEGIADIHEEQGWPEWMRRYVSAKEVSDVMARVPGLAWLAPAVGNLDAMTDPTNLLSISPLFRIFKSQNELLPDEEAGIRFLSGFVDGINDFGLGLSPFVRKPLEMAGVLNRRDWQSVFGQTALVEAFTRKYLHGLFPNGLNIEAMLADPLLARLGMKTMEEARAADFEEYVRGEMAGQRLRGEPVSREEAERKIRGWFFVQQTIGFFGGIYLRRMTPADFTLSQMADQMRTGELSYLNLSQDEQRAYDLFKRRHVDKYDELSYQEYLVNAPLVQAYYGIHDQKARERFLDENPQILPYLSHAWKGTPLSQDFIQTQKLVMDTKAAIDLFKLLKTVGIDHDTAALADHYLVTPELRRFWAKNDTPKEHRDKLTKGQYLRFLLGLNDTYWSLPDGAAKASYLEANPILLHWWNENNKPSDDLNAISNGANAALRDAYFHILDGGDGKGGKADWDGAAAFLRKHSFIFDGTSVEHKVNRKTGEVAWSRKAAAFQKVRPAMEHYLALKRRSPAAAKAWLNSEAGAGLREFWRLFPSSSPKAKAYRKAQPYLAHYFGLIDAKKYDEADAWLNAKTEGAAIVRDFFEKYASQSEKAKAFRKAQKWMKQYFALIEAKRYDAAEAWLAADTPGARLVRDYFAKFGDQSAGAKDFKAVEPFLKEYEAIKKQQGNAVAQKWLEDTPHGRLVMAFFKKYAKHNKYSRALVKAARSLSPEVNSRLWFWQHYFKLPLNERPAFILREGEKHGIFIYGMLGDKERHDAEKDYLRKAFSKGLRTERTALYLRVAPLIEVYSKLTDDAEKALFLKANPDVQEWFDRYAKKKSLTKNAAIDASIEAYFKLPRDSAARSVYLRNHPEVQDYFDSKSTPAMRAMHDLLDVYFALPSGPERKSYLERHPEVQAYFDQRERERNNEREQLEAFDDADPHLRPFFEDGREVIGRAARLERARHAARRAAGLVGDEIESRRDGRKPAPAL